MAYDCSSFSFWLISFCMVSSSSSMLLKMILFCSSLWLSSIPLCRGTTSLYVVCFKLMFSKFDWSFSYWDEPYLGCILVVCYIWCAIFLLRVFISISIVGLASLSCLYCFFLCVLRYSGVLTLCKEMGSSFSFLWPDKYIECVTYRVILDCSAFSTFSLSAVFLLCLWDMYRIQPFNKRFLLAT